MICVNVKAQSDTIVVQGNISTTVTAVSLQNIQIVVSYFDSSSFITDDTVYTNVSGNYSSFLIDSSVRKIDVKLRSCTSSTTFIHKSNTVAPWAGLVTYTVDFTNYCFNVNFSYFEHNDTVDYVSSVVGGDTSSAYSYFWDFGDGGPINNTANPQHVYSTGGPIYSVELEVIDGFSDSTSGIKSINIDDCISDFSYNQTGLFQIQFFDSSITNNIPNYYWDFGDSSTGNSANPLHNYPRSGTYFVCLTVTDSLSFCQDRYCSLILVDSNICTADFNITQIKNIVSFENLSYGLIPQNQLKSNWDFNNGDTSNIFSPVYIFETNSVFNVSLTVHDTSTGCQNIAFKSVSINSLNSNALFISGTIHVDDSADSSLATLVGETAQSDIEVLDTMYTFKGFYSFNVLPNSIYYTKGQGHFTAPNYNTIGPVYYQASTFWSSATAIVISNESSQNNNIDLTISSSLYGQSIISGFVSLYSGSINIPNTPIEGIDLFLFNSSDEFKLRTKSGSDGSYQFNDIETGSYKIYAEIPGKHTYPTTVSIVNIAENMDSVNFLIYPDYIIGQVEVNDISSIQIFPNPTTDVLNVTGGFWNNEDVQWRIINILGITENEGIIQMGNENVKQLETDYLKSGYYFLEFSSEKLHKVVRFQKTR